MRKTSLITVAIVALLAGGWMIGAPAARALGPGFAGGWMSQMHTPAMWDAMQSGNMWEYMNQPEIRQQLENTPMGQFMYTDDMQKFMTSDAFKEFSNSETAQQMIRQGGGSCHGAGFGAQDQTR